MNLRTSLLHTICAVILIYSTQLFSQNLLDTSSWTIGNGSTGGFSANGTANENIRETGFNHSGSQVVVWKAIPDAVSGPDGGWNSNYKVIDNNNSYRFTVWIKKTGSDNGTTYFGCQQWTSSVVSSIAVTRLNGIYQNNPYFWSGDLPELDKWYLLVGFIHNKDYSDTLNEGAIYDGVTGNLVQNILDFKFTNDTSIIRHRAYLYYTTDVQVRQYFYGPRIDLLDGTERSITELLNISNNPRLLFEYDNAGNQKQRFYCAVQGCTVADTPAGRPSLENSVDDEVVVETLRPKINIAPNPVKSSVSVYLDSVDDVYLTESIMIYSSSGSLVLEISIPRDVKTTQIDLSNLPSGIYLFHIHLSNSTSISKRVIKK